MEKAKINIWTIDSTKIGHEKLLKIILYQQISMA